jgi:hypothetical protein
VHLGLAASPHTHAVGPVNKLPLPQTTTTTTTANIPQDQPRTTHQPEQPQGPPGAVRTRTDARLHAWARTHARTRSDSAAKGRSQRSNRQDGQQDQQTGRGQHMHTAAHRGGYTRHSMHSTYKRTRRRSGAHSTQGRAASNNNKTTKQQNNKTTTQQNNNTTKQ